jgi:hypothetical protein
VRSKTIVMTFNNNVTGADSASTSCGTITDISVDPSDAHNLLVAFDGHGCNAVVVPVRRAVSGPGKRRRCSSPSG